MPWYWRIARDLCLAIAFLLPAWASAVEAPAPIPFKRERVGGETDLSRVGAGLLVGLGLACGVLVLLRRRYGPASRSGQRHLQVIESQRLNPKAALYVVEFAGKRYLLSHSEQGMQCLASSPAHGTTDMLQGESHA